MTTQKMKFSIQNNIISLFILFYINAQCNAEYIPPGPLYRCPTKPDKVKYSLKTHTIAFLCNILINLQLKLLYPCTCDKSSDSGLYVSCKNAGLATLSVGLENLAALKSPIEELVLSDCTIGE